MRSATMWTFPAATLVQKARAQTTLVGGECTRVEGDQLRQADHALLELERAILTRVGPGTPKAKALGELAELHDEFAEVARKKRLFESTRAAQLA